MQTFDGVGQSVNQQSRDTQRAAPGLLDGQVEEGAALHWYWLCPKLRYESLVNESIFHVKLVDEGLEQGLLLSDILVSLRRTLVEVVTAARFAPSYQFHSSHSSAPMRS
jgi:hypothetical protein